MPLSRPLPDEPLGIALLNTTWIAAGRSIDLLAELVTTRAWLDDVGLDAPASDAARLALLVARDAVRGHADNPASRSARAALNDVLRWGHSRPLLTADGVGHEDTTDESTNLAAWLAAVDYVRLVEGGQDRIRACAHPDCVLYFHDSSPRGVRRWCSMSGCGNRAKAARHYARVRPGA